MFHQRIMPVIEVYQRCRQAERRVLQAFADAHLHVYRHAFVVVFVGFKLSAQVLSHHRKRQFAVGIVIVQAKVYAHTNRSIVPDARRQHLCSDAASQLIGKHVREISRCGDVPSGKFAQVLVVGSGISHLAIVYIVNREGSRGALFYHLVVGHAGQINTPHEVHVVQCKCLIAHRRQQRRVVEHQPSIVVNERNVVAT